MASRDRQVVRASIVNIVGNTILSVFKMVVGFFSCSVAIIVDAVNNLTDALSSVVAIVGTKWAGRAADQKHPFGYGRMEYISSVAIAALIISASITSLIESVKSIINPPTLDYRPVILVIVAVACAVKAGLGGFLCREGKRLESDLLTGSGMDALLDSVVSVGTLVAAIVYLALGLRIEAWLGILTAALIGKSGAEMLVATISKILGERVDAEIISKVETVACEVEGVQLASGMVLQDYGYNRLHGSLYVTVDSSMPVSRFDEVARDVQRRVYKKCGVKLTSVGAYPGGGKDDDEHEVRAEIGRIVWMHDDVVELRGLYVDVLNKEARFDAVADFSRRELGELRQELVEQCEEALPGWTIEVRILTDL